MATSEKDNNESEKTNLISRIKTTTGAWWKSKVIAEKEEPDSSAPAPAGKPPVKQSQPEAGSGSGTDSTGSSSTAQADPQQPIRTPQTLESPQQQDKAASLATEERGASGQVQITETDSADADSATEKTTKPRRSRGRRGGRKKSAAKSDAGDQIGAQKPDEQPAAADNAAADSVEKSAKPQSRRSAEGTDKKQPEDQHQPVVKLLINADEPEECRLALLEDGRLESLHVTSVSRVHTRNNIYKARVVAVESNLQAAFVDYGTEKNGFLAFPEIHPEYFKQDLSPEIRALVESHQWKKLSISDVIAKGQEMLVQVVKEEIGKKGANLTTYLSIPGRCVVLMPGSDSEGISRKISGEEQRGRLREIMNTLSIPEGIGWIVRTASEDITKTALTRDVKFLLRLWKEIKSKGQHLEGVGLLYQDHNCVMRFLREQFDPTTQEILVDDETALEKVKEFTEMLPAKQRKVKVKLHRGARPIFNQYSVEDQIESIYQPRVNLPSGGSIIIEPTEALVSIDVNSGSTGKGKNFEETIFMANMEAARELARQLRLRDLGGLIVVDFIDMRSSKNIREVEKQVKTSMKRDRAKVDISRISRFGLMQISRQKLGSPIESGNYRICEHCRGRGTVRSVETMALFYLRRIHTGASRKPVVKIDCRFPLDVAQYLLNNKRQEIMELEEKYDAKVIITADPSLKPSEHEIAFRKAEKEEPEKKTGLS